MQERSYALQQKAAIAQIEEEPGRRAQEHAHAVNRESVQLFLRRQIVEFTNRKAPIARDDMHIVSSLGQIAGVVPHNLLDTKHLGQKEWANNCNSHDLSLIDVR